MCIYEKNEFSSFLWYGWQLCLELMNSENDYMKLITCCCVCCIYLGMHLTIILHIDHHEEMYILAKKHLLNRMLHSSKWLDRISSIRKIQLYRYDTFNGCILYVSFKHKCKKRENLVVKLWISQTCFLGKVKRCSSF